MDRKKSIQFVVNSQVDTETIETLMDLFGGYIYNLTTSVLVWRDMSISHEKAATLLSKQFNCDVITYNRNDMPTSPKRYVNIPQNTAVYVVEYYGGKRRNFRSRKEVIADKKKHPTAMYFWDPRRKKRVYFAEFSTTDARKCPCDIR